LKNIEKFKKWEFLWKFLYGFVGETLFLAQK